MRSWLILPVLSATLLAQDPGSVEIQDLVRLLEQPIQSASKRLQRLKEAPVDATVLTGAELRALGYRTVGEALGGVLGFGTNQDHSYATVTARGLSVSGDLDSRVQILLDGHTLNAGAGIQAGLTGEALGIPLDRIERIEVIRGPASALYGNKAFQGLINIITRPIADGGEAALEAQQRGGLGLWARAGRTAKAFSWELLATGWNRKGTALTFPELQAEPLSREGDQEDRHSAYFRATGTAWSLAAYTTGRTQYLASAPYGAEVGDPSTYYQDNLLFGEFKAEPRFGKVETLVRLFGDRYIFKDYFPYHGIRDLAFTVPSGDDIPDYSLGAELQARVPVGASGKLTVGAERQWHRYESRTFIEGENLGTRVKNQTGNTYLQGEWAPGEAVTVLAGIQLASFQVHEAESLAQGLWTAIPKADMQDVTPRFSLIWKPSPNDVVKLLYGGGYRYPTYYDRYYTDNATQVTSPTLQAETIRTAQAIWVHDLGDSTQVQVGASEFWWKNLIAYVGLDSGLQQAQNTAGEVRGRAAEFELQSRRADWIWMVQGGFYHWTKATGEAFPNSAPAQGAARLTRRWEALSASGELRYGGRRENPAEGAVARAVTVVRFALRWDEPRFWASASLEDAFNRRRVDLVNLEYLPITKMAADGRTWRIAVGARF